MSSSSSDPRTEYCRQKQIHHLFELLATKVLHDRPENPFEYLRALLSSVEEAEKKPKTYDPTQTHHHGNNNNNGGENNNSGAEKRKKVTVAVLGLDNAGKTALISLLSGAVDEHTTPTVGFSPTHFSTDDADVSFFDLGGGGNFRGIWQHYFHDCHGFVFVVDCADHTRLAEAKQCFHDVLSHKYMSGKPFLLVANKKDVSGALSLSAVEQELFNNNNNNNVMDMIKQTIHKSIYTCAITEDPDVEEGVEWLLTSILEQHTALAQRVSQDTRSVKEEKEKRMAEQRARVAAMRAEEDK